MKTWMRARTRWLLGLALIAALVAGGLGWASSAALQLEQDHYAGQAQADHAERLRVLQRERDQRQQSRQREHDQLVQSRLREQAQQEAQAQEAYTIRLRLAMWKLDSRIARVLAREDARPYQHYNPVYTPSVALTPGGLRCDDGAVLEPSPLLSMDLPDWMLLHFQTAAETGWGSPQVLPVDYQKLLTRNRVVISNVTRQRIQLLAEMSTTDTTAILVQGIEQQELQFSVANNEALSNVGNALNPGQLANAQVGNGQGGALARGPEQQPPQPQPQQGQQGKTQPTQQKDLSQFQATYGQDYPNRLQQRNSIYNERFKGNFYLDEDANVWAANTNMKTWAVTGGKRFGTANPVLVSVSPMVPLWLTTAADQERLVVARLVRISSRAEELLALVAACPPGARPTAMAGLGLHEALRLKAGQPRLVCQGIVLDWPHLEQLLTAEVRDLFPKAKVLPMRADPPTHPERTMTALPVELDPGETPAAPEAEPLPEGPAPEAEPADPVADDPPQLGWTPLRVGLGLAWAAALVALTAVGLGGWSLLELSERRIRFVSAVTHELRTPLTTLRLYLDMLTGGLVRSEEQRDQYLQTLHGEAERLNRLVGNVLDFSRLENQRPRLELAPVRLGDLLGQLTTTWHTRCADTEKVLEVENALGDDRTLVTDVHLVRQIVGNLIDNACKYSRGAADPHLWLRVRPGGAGRVRVEVEDRGPGVKAAERNAIFRPFCRGHDSDVVAGGVGLGLALAQRWAGLLGGTLALEAPAGGVGACFVLELPVST
jgi:signal transduction histidine kinase